VSRSSFLFLCWSSLGWSSFGWRGLVFAFVFGTTLGGGGGGGDLLLGGIPALLWRRLLIIFVIVSSWGLSIRSGLGRFLSLGLAATLLGSGSSGLRCGCSIWSRVNKE
jgi:hypothetical protein